jgi:hypothetical protein
MSGRGARLVGVLCAGLLGLAASSVRAQVADGGAVVDAPAADVRAAELAPDAGESRAAIVPMVDAGTTADAAVPARTEEREEPLPEAHRPRLQAELTPREGVVTGELLHLTLRANALEGDDVTVPQQSFAPLEAHARRVRTEPARDGRRTHVFELDLLALEPGEHTLPALKLRVVTADGTVGSVRTEPIRFRVRSVLGNEPNAQPKAPTQPVVVMQDDYTLAWVLGALGVVLITALLTWLGLRWWSRRAKPAAPPPPPRPPWERALEQLDALRQDARRLMAEGREREFVARTSDTLREYLGGRYGFDGLESTTDEILARLRKADVRGVSREEIAALLGDADLVKFAKAVPDEAQCEAILAGAYRVVRATSGMPGVGVPSAGVPMAAGGAPAATAGAWPTRVEGAAGAQGTRGAAGEVSPVEVAAVEIETRELPDGSVAITLGARDATRLAATLERAVREAVDARSGDVGFSGAVTVALGPTLPDDAVTRAAITAALAQLAGALREARTARGMRVQVRVEHVHELPASPDAPVRRSVYEMPMRRGEGSAS